MKKFKSKRVWNKLFGLPVGTLIRPNQHFIDNFVNCYLWTEAKEPQIIPATKFVGVIERAFPSLEGNHFIYSIRWIADRRKSSEEFSRFVWWEFYLEEL